MEINLLKFLKYTTLLSVLSFSVNADSMFTYEQFQNASNAFDIALRNKISDCIHHRDNNRIMNKLVFLRNYEMPILNVRENDLRLFGINNNNVRNIVHQINTLKNDLKNEIDNKIMPVLKYDNNLSDELRQALHHKMKIVENISNRIKKGNFTNNMYIQLVNYNLINNPNNNLSNVEQILNMQESFGTMLYKIKSEQNLEEKNKLIQSVYLHLAGNNYNNLDILMNYADQNVLNNINDILNIQEVKDYIQSYNLDKVDLNINVGKEIFTEDDGFQVDYGKSFDENKDVFMRLYYQVLDKSVGGNIQDIRDFKDIINNLNNHLNSNVQKSIIEKLENYYNTKEELINNKLQQAKNEYENVFKELWDKQFKSQPLNKLLNADFDLNAIRDEINKAENIDEKKQAIQTNFIDTIFGENFENLSTILTSNNGEDLEKIYNILNSEKVTDYMTNNVIQSRISNLTKRFHSNIMNINGNQNGKTIDNYVDDVLYKFSKINNNIKRFINKINSNNENIINDFARDIKDLLESHANKKMDIMEKETEKLLNNPYKYFFDNLIKY